MGILDRTLQLFSARESTRRGEISSNRFQGKYSEGRKKLSKKKGRGKGSGPKPLVHLITTNPPTQKKFLILRGKRKTLPSFFTENWKGRRIPRAAVKLLKRQKKASW